MSLNGKLEDVSLADVMQFVHLGRRTGTLYLVRGSEEAEIGFYRGQIVSAISSRATRLSDLLVSNGVLPADVVARMLELQRVEKPRRSLGQILVTSGTLSSEHVKDVLRLQVEGAIYELVTWSSGSFEFALDHLQPSEDLALYPGDTAPKLDLNTQMVLLEAARVLDEARDHAARGLDPMEPARRRRRPIEVEPSQGADEPLLGEELALSAVSEAIEELDFEPEAEDADLLPVAAKRRLQVVSPDRDLAEALADIIQPEIAQVVRVPLREAGTRLPGEPSPTVVVLDLREGHHGVEELLSIRRSRPRSSVIAVVDSSELTTSAFEAGALAAVAADPAALAACFHSLMRTLHDAGPERSAKTRQRAGFARLRRVLADIRSGLLSATMALNLMHIVSESVERAVLLLVREDGLSALGAFGFGVDGRPLAEATCRLVLPADDPGVLGRCVADGQPRSTGFDQAELPVELSSLLGRPRNGQVVVFPVMGSEQVIAVVYTDNGSNQQAIEDIELLELATAQVGVAFENELLRRKMGTR